MDVYFWFDVFLNFNLGYYDQNQILIMEWKQIARQYVWGWLTVDIIANLPVNYISEYIEDFYEWAKWIWVLKMVRGVRILRVIRVFKISKFIEGIEDRFHIDQIFVIVDMIKLLIRLLIIIHFAACVSFITL